MPLTGSCSCEDLHNSSRRWEILLVLVGFGMVGCNPLLGFEPLLGWHPELAKLAKRFEVLPLQVDLAPVALLKTK